MKPIRIGIAGLGNVGEEVAYQLIKGFRVQNDQFQIELHGVSAKSKDKKRKVNIKNIPFFDDPVAMSHSPDIDVIVELIGGDDGVAKDLCFSSLQNKKGLITANKALIAKYGKELAEIAENDNLFFSFEASVAGGIPILKLIREGLIVNEITKLTGILNGTANYILSEMELTEKNFDEVLSDAQKKGYAEADPSFDIDGIDAAHKTIILSGLAYGKMPNINNLAIKGIRNISLNDIKYCSELGYKIKLLGNSLVTKNEDNEEELFCSIEPWLIPKNFGLSNVSGVLNAVQVQSSLAGSVMITGAGAGGKPTASAVLADIVDFANGTNLLSFGRSSFEIKNNYNTKAYVDKFRFYLRLNVIDKSGVLANLTSIFKDHELSIESFIQKSNHEDKTAELVIITHEADKLILDKALISIIKLDGVIAEPVCLSIYS
ncbi:homoserine dehydrogenase [Pseudomonadota bacterium]|nr:homoserine dehydrogenase [Pseudomonadota bacterium]